MPGVAASVAGLWRYPASSLAGEAMAAIAIGAGGVAGDRGYGIIDAAGDIARPTAPDGRWRKTALIAARLSPGGALAIAVPGGDWLPAPGAAADAAVSAFLGFAARLVPLSGEPAPPGYAGPLGAARYVKAPVHLLTTASLARLRALHPAGAVEPRRFRSNILVELGEDGFAEAGWTGGRIRIGEVELAVSEPCRRCGFTTLAQEGLDEDPEILRTIVRHAGRNLGVYCAVARPGRVSLGDAVRLVG
ncbi:MAG: molybdenum cofactor sulfurase [Alphaproteobacteria bacterium]|nr:MAG: molybdenum cofactor sulfurase [Alphaproteobacteria bacterium]